MSSDLPPVYTVTLNPGLDRTLTVPALVENTVLRATESRLDWGGKGFNVTRGLHALGVTSVAMGFVGGFTGQMLAAGLADLGITVDFVTIEGETRTNTVVAEAESGRYFKVNEAGPVVSAVALDLLRTRVETHVTPGSTWAFCGSLPPGVPASTYADLITLVQSRGGIAYLDASGEALRLGCAARPATVKPNAGEAQEMTGVAVDSVAAAQVAATRFLTLGIETVALSLGADGLLLMTRDGAVYARPPQVPVQTLVGVGDALLAGLIFAQRLGLGLPDIAHWAVAAGTAAAMTAGVAVGSLGEVAALLPQVAVTPL
jgi:1-phosphofructokinase/6-phosphofructokinase 2